MKGSRCSWRHEGFAKGDCSASSIPVASPAAESSVNGVRRSGEAVVYVVRAWVRENDALYPETGARLRGSAQNVG